MTRANWTSATAWLDRPPPFHPWKLFFKAYPTKSLSLPLYPTIFSLYPSGLSHSLSVGLQKPHSGVVRIGGRDLLRAQWLARARMERRFGILFQKGALYSSLTVLENVALPLIEHVGLARPLAERLARSKLGLVGLPAGAGDKYPASLSGGMVKRAALARALALDANILFLDEPTAGLDPIGAASFDQLILTLRNALGLTVFLVTHDLDTLYTICDRVAVLANQKVLINDGIEAVERFKHPWIQEYFHGPRGRAAAQATGASSQETQP
ncbi:ATP-binding cassette domain-containing protein [Pseudomonas aeruginosa]|nr:ATP-binding cassette domain-containing protein [Pseudomonas aeruginosa]MCU8880590.1 ATP-binding cassette domain-containing protein [Pseudomonas aeruginosa]MCU8904637.1 ATP-binding cassette domain-containing protein [Pseudomonas aeruginosa]MCU8961758.1 ATP-binding cassette domain-containing protein [Pseudomonas aeruginosa]MCU9513101.1 ATP-binding cassette domain-containing protein [Pseudomonas aeruginosa]